MRQMSEATQSISEEEKASRVVDTMTHEEPAPSRNQIRGHRTTKLITAKRKDLADKSAVSGADLRRLQASESKNVKAAGNSVHTDGILFSRCIQPR